MEVCSCGHRHPCRKVRNPLIVAQRGASSALRGRPKPRVIPHQRCAGRTAPAHAQSPSAAVAQRAVAACSLRSVRRSQPDRCRIGRLGAAPTGSARLSAPPLELSVAETCSCKAPAGACGGARRRSQPRAHRSREGMRLRSRLRCVTRTPSSAIQQRIRHRHRRHAPADTHTTSSHGPPPLSSSHAQTAHAAPPSAHTSPRQTDPQHSAPEPAPHDSQRTYRHSASPAAADRAAHPPSP